MPAPGGPISNSLRRGLPLLDDHTLQPVAQLMREHHARETRIDIFGCDQVRQLAARLHQGDSPPPPLRLAAGTGIIDHLAQLLRDLAVAETRFVGGRLHGDRQELLFIAIDVTLQQRDEVGGLCHRLPPVLSFFMHSSRAVCCGNARKTRYDRLPPSREPFYRRSSVVTTKSVPGSPR